MILSSSAAVAGCGSESTPESRYGWYHAVVSFDAARKEPLPFFLYLPGPGEKALVVNGEENIPAVHRWTDRRVEVSLAYYEWQIEARVDSRGVLVGELVATHPVFDVDLIEGESHMSLPLRARRVARPDPLMRFDLDGDGPPAAFAGTWRIVPEHPLDHSQRIGVSYKAVLKQEGTVVSGDIILDTGDLRYLGGNARGKTMVMGTLDGSHFVTMHADLAAPDHMTGEIFLNRERTRFTATRARSLPYTEVQPPLVDVDLNGWNLPALDQERYRGKPVILEFFGTWCSSCNDAVPLFKELYERYRPQGLEILGVSVEMSEDMGYVVPLVERYRKRHDIRWETIAVTDYTHFQDELMRPFPDSFALPLTIFFRRDGSAEAVRAGFIGPASPEDHATMRAEFDRLAQAIVASKPP